MVCDMTHTAPSELPTTSAATTRSAQAPPGSPRFRDLIGVYALVTVAIPGTLALAARPRPLTSTRPSRHRGVGTQSSFPSAMWCACRERVPRVEGGACPTKWISTTSRPPGLESSPVAAALAGLRANEARYFKNKYDHVFTVEPASEAKQDDRLGAPHPEGGARPRHRIAAPRGDALSGREHPDRLRVLRERPLDQRDVRRRRRRRNGPSGSSSPTGWRCPPSWPRGSSSPGRSRSWPARSAVRSS